MGDFFEHVLFLRSAVLGKGAVEGERNIVELETKHFEGQVMKQPLISLTLGRNDMTMLDMNFSHETAATFRLVEGTGPVYLAAMHQTEFPVEEDTEETEDDNGTDLEYTEDGDTATQDSEGTDGEGSGKKRKAGSMKKTSKRGKLDSASSAPTSTAEEEESEDGSESEDIEESPSPKKKNKNDAKTKG